MKSLRFFALFGLFGIAACAVPADPGGETAATDASEDEVSASTPQHHVATVDMRKCASPMCGGYFVSRVNRKTTRCLDGTWAPACYVVGLDLSPMKLSDKSADYLRSGVTWKAETAQSVFYGTIVPANLGDKWKGFANFRATAAWRAPEPATWSGTFYDVSSSHIVCITYPCPTLHEDRLNGWPDRNIHGIDLADAPGNIKQKAAAAQAASSDVGLVATGQNVVIPKAGPAGAAVELDANQYFMRIKY